MKKIGTVTVTTGCTSTSYETLPNGTYDLFIDPEQALFADIVNLARRRTCTYDDIPSNTDRKPGKRFLGTFRTPDGHAHGISRDTPVDILLDCIEQLGEDRAREITSHKRTLDLLTIRSPR